MKNVGAVIVAGGSSSRMNGVDKQFCVIDGVSVIERAVRAFASCGRVCEIVVVAREESIGAMTFLFDKYDLPVKAVPGGKTRFLSAVNGFSALSEKAELVAVHDGARPLVTEEIIEAAIRGAEEFGAAIAAVKSKDTVKITEDGFVLQTPERERCFLAQTPQVFRREIYAKALSAAEKSGKTDFTDDAQMAEACGVKIRVAEGSYSNIKITTQSDLMLAEELIIGQR